MSSLIEEKAVELTIGGMTCASCANRIERKLNKLEGVTATVNYATEKAKVTFPDDLDPQELISEVEKAGYSATLPADDPQPVDNPDNSLRDRLITAVVLSVPVVAMAMIPALQFTYWQWLSLTLAAPVVVWAGWPFHRAAWTNLGTARRRWTRWSRWARWPRSAGRCGRSSSVRPGCRA